MHCKKNFLCLNRLSTGSGYDSINTVSEYVATWYYFLKKSIYKKWTDLLTENLLCIQKKAKHYNELRLVYII